MRTRRIQYLALLLPLVATAAPAANDIQTSGSFVSTVAPGTSPLEVASTTRVDNLNAEYLDGWSAASFLRPLANVITVSPSGGDFTSIQAALNSISDASPFNRYAVLVGPGTYEGKITLKSWVSVIGASPQLTRIESDGGVFDFFAATVAGADNAELRNLTVLSEAASSGFQYAVGILAYETRPILRDLEIYASGSSIASIGILNVNNGPELSVEDCFILATHSEDTYGIYNRAASLIVSRSRVEAFHGSTDSYGIFNEATVGDYSVSVIHSELVGSSTYLSNDENFSAFLSSSTLGGGSVIANGSSPRCAFVTDGADGYASACP
jgi:hypothetical protein